MERYEEYDASKAVPPCMRMRECNSSCYYYRDCWPEEYEDDDERC